MSNDNKKHLVGSVPLSVVQNTFEDLEDIRNDFTSFKRRSNFATEVIKTSVVLKHMRYAYDWSFESYARRRKVGAVIYKNGHPLSSGYNGMPSGETNNCEIESDNGVLITKNEVIHAEKNALYKVSSFDDAANASIFVTTAPCTNCSEEIYMRHLTKVYFSEIYRVVDGLEYLIKRGVSISFVNMVTGEVEDVYVSDEKQDVDLKIKSIVDLRTKFKNDYYPLSNKIEHIYSFFEKKS